MEFPGGYTFPFEKPDTSFNRLVAKIHGPIRHRIKKSDLKRWQESSLRAFIDLGVSKAVLKKVLQTTRWELSKNKAPKGTWYGEILTHKKNSPPIAVVYQDSLTARLPSLSFEFAGQSGMDHFFGHLVGLHQKKEWGEEVACRWQFKAAKIRKGLKWFITQNLVALLQKLHKEVPFSKLT